MGRLASQLRFLRSVALAAVVLGGLAVISALAASRTDSTLQLWIIGIGAVSVGLGALLAYQVSIDWLNLRVIRRNRVVPGAPPRDGAVVAFEGMAHVDGEALTSPLGGVPCAAYSYKVSRLVSSSLQSRPGSRHVVCAQGWHMLPTRIVGSADTLALHSFPGFEDELRVVGSNDSWLGAARSLVERLEDTAEPGGQRERESGLLEARHSLLEEVHQDYLVMNLGSEVGLHYEEETLPVGEPLCIVGTFDPERQALTSRRSRLGSNLIAYRGSADDVLERLGGEATGYTKLALALITVGALMVGHPFVVDALAGAPADDETSVEALDDRY